jgi:hypothetical protein
MTEHEPVHTDLDINCSACDWYNNEPQGRSWWDHIRDLVIDVNHASDQHYAQSVHCDDDLCPLNWARLTAEHREAAK